MNKLKYIIVPALTGLLFTACNNEPKAPSQADLDAKIEAKVNARTMELKQECDTRILEAAKLKADSIMNAATPAAAPKPTASTTPKAPTVKTPTVKTPVKEPNNTVEAGGLRSQSDQAKDKDKKAVEGGGLRTQSDQSKAKDKKSVEGGGLRSQSDQAKEKK